MVCTADLPGLYPALGIVQRLFVPGQEKISQPAIHQTFGAAGSGCVFLEGFVYIDVYPDSSRVWLPAEMGINSIFIPAYRHFALVYLIADCVASHDGNGFSCTGRKK